MSDSSKNSKPLFEANKIWSFIRKNGFTILMGTAMVTLLINPDAKSWVLRQLMLTGLFNPTIEKKSRISQTKSTTDFEFSDDKGLVHNTSSLRGKVVFINFWASWCGPCRAEFPSIEQLYGRFKTHPNLYFLIINQDEDLSKATHYLEQEQFTIPFHQSNGFIPDAIYTGTLPTTVVLDKSGVIRYRHEGFANYASEQFIKQIEDLIAE